RPALNRLPNLLVGNPFIFNFQLLRRWPRQRPLSLDHRYRRRSRWHRRRRNRNHRSSRRTDRNRLRRCNNRNRRARRLRLRHFDRSFPHHHRVRQLLLLFDFLLHEHFRHALLIALRLRQPLQHQRIIHRPLIRFLKQHPISLMRRRQIPRRRQRLSLLLHHHQFRIIRLLRLIPSRNRKRQHNRQRDQHHPNRPGQRRPKSVVSSSYRHRGVR